MSLESLKSESVGSSLESQKSESVESSDKSRKRGKDLLWQEVERFDNPEAFNRSQIKMELDRKMRKHRVWRSAGARNQGFVCKVFRKQGWKSCPRKYRVSLFYQSCCDHVNESQVMYLNTSFSIVVLSTSEEHHHEEKPDFSTKENYHWTAQQEKVPHTFPH